MTTTKSKGNYYRVKIRVEEGSSDGRGSIELAHQLSVSGGLLCTTHLFFQLALGAAQTDLVRGDNVNALHICVGRNVADHLQSN